MGTAPDCDFSIFQLDSTARFFEKRSVPTVGLQAPHYSLIILASVPPYNARRTALELRGFGRWPEPARKTPPAQAVQPASTGISPSHFLTLSSAIQVRFRPENMKRPLPSDSSAWFVKKCARDSLAHQAANGKELLSSSLTSLSARERPLTTCRK